MLAIIYSFLHNRWNLQTLNLSPQLIFASYLMDRFIYLPDHENNETKRIWDTFKLDFPA